MGTNTISTFNRHNPFSDSSGSPGRANHGRCKADLITILAVVQKLTIPVLPIQWQSFQPPLGVGGQGRIGKISVTLREGFAFKRFMDGRDSHEAEQRTLQTILNEIAVLRHWFQSHPNLVQLQGICWDVTTVKAVNGPQCNIWPALVLEEADHGDLYQFASSHRAHELDIMVRLELCLNVCVAIGDMHVAGIFHGDVKPQNVLIFEHETYPFLIAKVTDFGYSKCNDTEDENDKVIVPRSWPWYAPEHKFHPVQIEEAQKMDIFSVGMLFMWFLFEAYFSGRKPFPQELQQLTSGHHVEKHNPAWELLEMLKLQDQLVLVAVTLLHSDNDMQDDGEDAMRSRATLEAIFRKTLACDPSLRIKGLTAFVEGYSTTISELKKGQGSSSRQLIPDETFTLSKSLATSYQSDYRLRQHIIQALELRYQVCNTNSLALQLALCYRIGFGCVRSELKAREVLDCSHITPQTLDASFEQLKAYNSAEHERVENSGIAFHDMNQTGYVNPADPYHYYLEHNCLETATSTIRREVQDLDYILGSENLIVAKLKNILFSLLLQQGMYDEAEKLQMQVVEAMTQLLGRDNIFTVKCLGDLASIYRQRGRLAEAEEIYRSTLETTRTLLGDMHGSTLWTMHNLARTFNDQGKGEQALTLESQVLSRCQNSLSPDNALALSSLSNLSLAYCNCEQWEAAETVQLLYIDRSETFLGQMHPSTMQGLDRLVSICARTGRQDYAKDMRLHIMDQQQTLPTSYGTVLAQEKSKGAHLYRHQSSASLEGNAAEMHTELCTFVKKLYLTLALKHEKRYQEAASLLEQCAKLLKQHLGVDHIISGILDITRAIWGEWYGFLPPLPPRPAV